MDERPRARLARRLLAGALVVLVAFGIAALSPVGAGHAAAASPTQPEMKRLSRAAPSSLVPCRIFVVATRRAAFVHDRGVGKAMELFREKASGYGFRAGFTPLELIPWKGVTVRLSGYYEVFSMSFQNGSQSASQYELPPTDTVKGRQGRALEDASRYIARGASDQYFGGLVQVGYQY